MKLKIDPAAYETCPPFNDWLDDQYIGAAGTLSILGFQPRPSFVLFSMSPATYQALFADFQQERQEQLREAICNNFPAPIAHYFYRFENGYESELQRLLFMRDTWEAAVDILHAAAISECRLRKLALADPVKMSLILTDSVAQRIQNTELLIQSAACAGGPLGISKVVSSGCLQLMRELNQTRNAFSHGAAQSEAQARLWVGDCYEDLMDILDEIRLLEDVQVMRYLGQTDRLTLRCEMFRGHGFTKTIRSVSFSEEQLRDSNAYLIQGQILMLLDGRLLSLSPLIHFREDATGQVTKLCMFRKARGDAPSRELEFEIVGEAERHKEIRSGFKNSLDEIRSLFGLGPDI